MNPFLLVKGELRACRGGIAALAFVLALALGLGVGVSVTERAVRQGTAAAADDFDLLVGARGSSVQLLLGSVYLRPQQLPLLPADVVHQVRAQQGVAWAAPLAFGDRWKRSPLVGTTEDMVTLGGRRALAEGRSFAAQNEAVIGAAVPLTVGAEFSPVHGRIAGSGEKHDHVHFRVVGRLHPTGTPWDSAILVPVTALWAAHHLLDHLPEGDRHGLDVPRASDHPLPGVSSVVVKPVSIADAYRLRGFWQTAHVGGGDVPVATQGIFTGEVLTELYATLGDMRALMSAMAWAAQGVALAGVILTAAMAVRLRRSLLDTLRVIGAPRLYLVSTAWCVVSVSVLLGCLGGLGAGFVLAKGVALAFADQTGVVLAPALGRPEVDFALLSFLIGSCCALIPALLLYRDAARTR